MSNIDTLFNEQNFYEKLEKIISKKKKTDLQGDKLRIFERVTDL